MRPLYLEMTAFGSYAQKTALPFEDLRHDLYLVTGDTGAGKTTIFDAIMFALFGRASGTDRKGDMLHCDHVPKSTDTVVRLRFSQGGKEYTVTRTLHFARKRGSEGQYGDGKLSAVLEEPDQPPTEGSEKVTARCEILLGMNADQFRKIIMLAQGEFKEFLKADSDRKNEILGKLFDNSPYVYYQNLLTGTRDALRQRREQDEAQLQNLMLSVFLPPAGTDESREDYLPGHPALAENLTRLTEEEQGRLEALREVQTAVSQRAADLNTRKGAAETMNGLLLELKGEREKLAGLEALDPEMEARRQVCERAETAFRKAKPAVDAFLQAGKRLKDVSAEIEALTGRLEELDRTAEAAGKKVEDDAENEAERDAVRRKLDAIQEQLPRYKDLAKKRQELLAAKRAAEKAASDREEEEDVRDRTEQEIRRLNEKLEELSQADADLRKCEYEKQRADDDLEALTGKTGLQKDLLDILSLERKSETEKQRLLDLTGQAQTATDRYADLYRRFIAGQAGLLADDLRGELSEKGEAVCPVCGSSLCSSHLDRLALRRSDTPDKWEVEEAEKARNDLEALRSEQATAVETNASTIRLKKDAALRRAMTLLPDCDSWERLSDPAYFSAAAEHAGATAEEAKRNRTLAKERQKERDGYRKQLPDRERERDASLDRIRDLLKEEQQQVSLTAGLESAIEEIKNRLLYEDEQTAEQVKKELDKRFSDLSDLIRTHRDALKQAEEERVSCQGNLEGKQAAKEKGALELESARDVMERILKETDFHTEAAMVKALAPMGETDGESWLNTERAALDGHSYAKRHARETITDLETRTAGKDWVDLTALEGQLEAAAEENRQAQAACSELEALLNNHRTVLARVREIRARLDASEKAWQRLSALASLAGGASGEGGKVSFDRYVMGTVFREILEQANRRMELMSGGRYELVHTVSAARKNARAGLEIEVLDNLTGIRRGSGSLSGGESFFTSLALALGLSDVVQNHAGGKRMDALFIDEGFGTLSSDVLEKALEVLNQLTGGNRLVGIISHVDKLDESIPQKIRVRHGDRGSTLALELA